jgi:hypothetical protein
MNRITSIFIGIVVLGFSTFLVHAQKPATASATVVNGFVVAISVKDGGSGYTAAPAVKITGGGGSGATALATIKNGSVEKITVQSPGSGYGSNVSVEMAPVSGPAFDFGKGLIAYYPFNGNAKDECGKGHDGVVTGATLCTDRFGEADRAYSFDGKTAFIGIPHRPDLDLPQDFTLSVWLFQRRGGIMAVMDKKTAGRNLADGWRLDTGAPGPLRARFVGGDPMMDINGNSPFTVNEWHHLAVSVSGEKGDIYLDGKLDGSNRFEKRTTNTHSLYFGKCHPTPVAPALFCFNGSLDDIRVYSRALPEEEIKALYRREKSK